MYLHTATGMVLGAKPRQNVA